MSGPPIDRPEPWAEQPTVSFSLELTERESLTVRHALRDLASRSLHHGDLQEAQRIHALHDWVQERESVAVQQRDVERGRRRDDGVPR